MKYLNTLLIVFFLTACHEKQADCDFFNHESETIYHHLTLLDQDIKIRVDAFDQEKPKDLMSNENYQQLQNLRIQRDESFKELRELSKLHPQCLFEKSSPLGLELKQYILDHQ